MHISWTNIKYINNVSKTYPNLSYMSLFSVAWTPHMYILMSPCKTIWHHMVPYGIVCNHMAPYGTMCHHMVPHGTICHQRRSWKENVPNPFSFTAKSGATDHLVQARREQVSRSPHPVHNLGMAPTLGNPKRQSVQPLKTARNPTDKSVWVISLKIRVCHCMQG